MGTVENSILSVGVTIEEGAVVRDSVIMDDVTVQSGAQVNTAIVDADSVITSGATVGIPDAGKSRIAVVAKGSTISGKYGQDV